MPRPKKDTVANEKTAESKATTVKKATSKKSTSTKKSATKNNTTSKKVATKKSVSTTGKKVANKSAVTSSKKTSAKKTSSAATKSAKTSSITINRKKTTKKVKDANVNILEYYDLPYRYNETVVKILAQTPKVLFVYWDISDSDREKYKEKYGEYFFNDTYPVLIVHNKSLDYYQEIEINDFANSWYISIPDSRSEYNVELGRRFKEYAKRNPDMPHKEDLNSVINISYSNDLIMPNDHVLLDEIKSQVKFRNVKTNKDFFVDTYHILANNNLINFYNLYKGLYQVEDLSNIFSLTNPSSGNPTSTFK